MKLIILLPLAVAATCLQAQYNYQNLSVKTELPPEQLNLLTYENLRIYPVTAKESFVNYFRNTGKYTVLKDALEKQKVKITETGAGNSDAGNTVNTLYIQNLSADTVYLMGGEVVKGGNQDRVIAKDVILPPNSNKTALDVYCVEHGRWSGNDIFQTTGGVVNTTVRKMAEVDKDQSKVWDKVAEVTTKNKSETETGTFAALNNSKEYKDKTDKYVAFFTSQLAGEKNVIGVIAASGDKIIGCDMFATSILFSQQAENLLKSYSTEAITNGAPVKISNAAVKTYADNLLQNEAKQKQMIEQDGKEFKKEGKVLHLSVY